MLSFSTKVTPTKMYLRVYHQKLLPTFDFKGFKKVFFSGTPNILKQRY